MDSPSTSSATSRSDRSPEPGGPESPAGGVDPGRFGPVNAHSGRRRIALIAAGVFTLAATAMWIWMLFVYDPGLLIDELPDPAFATDAEEVCAAATSVISDLKPAEATNDPIERADVIVTANDTLARMLGELRTLVPSEPPESTEAINEWLDDWATHVQDRQDYAEELRVDPTARFTETPKASKQISRAIDSFAQVNRMPSCETPGDV